MFPNAILLNTREAVQRIRSLPHSQEPTVWRMFVTYALEDLVDCFRNGASSTTKLKELHQQIDKGKYKQYFNQPHLLADTVLWAGEQIRQTLQEVKAYDPDGVLRYTYYPVHAPGFNDMLLIHEKELPPPKDSSHA
jgi:hypothetical protein